MMFLTLLPFAAAGLQDRPLPPVAIPALPELAAANAFAPQGWRVEAQATGDLNRDGLADVALVLRATDAAARIATGSCEDPLDTNPRILVVAFATGDGQYRRSATNARLLARRDNPCAVDPFDPNGSLAIRKGSLHLSLERLMSMGGWDAGTTHFVFRWQDRRMRLIGWDYARVRRNTGQASTIRINFASGRVETGTGAVGVKVRKPLVTRRGKGAPALDQLGDALAFDPDGRVAALP